MQVELDEVQPLGFRVDVTVFREDGWEERPTKTWYRKNDRDETLAQFLASFAHLPGPEATSLATQLEGPWRDEWRNTGGEAEARAIQRFVRWGFAGIFFVLMLAVAGVVLLVWVLVTQI